MIGVRSRIASVLKNSLAARIILLVLTIVMAGQLAFGVLSVKESRSQAADAQQQMLDLAERIVSNRLGQARAEALLDVQQLARDPVLARALSSRVNEALQGQMNDALRRSSARRVMLVRNPGSVLVDIGLEGAGAPVRAGYWGSALSPMFRVGRGTGFVEAGGQTVMWGAGPIPIDPTLAVVLIYPLGSMLAQDFNKVGLAVHLDIASGAMAQSARGLPTERLQRRLYLSGADSEPISVLLTIAGGSSTTLYQQAVTQWLPAFGGALLLSLLAIALLYRPALEPVARLATRLRAQVAGQLKPIGNEFGRGGLGRVAGAFDELAGDITRLEKQYQRAAFRDEDTGLPNRTLLLQRMSDAVQASRRTHIGLSLLLIGIEQFQAVNDSLGQPAAKALLLGLAERMRTRLREAESMIEMTSTRIPTTLARVRDDQLAVLLPSCDGPQAIQVARRLVALAEEPVAHEGQWIQSRLRIGVAHCPEHAEDAEALHRAAELALAAARRGDTDCEAFSPELAREREIEISIVPWLHRALDEGQITLRYRPTVALNQQGQLLVEVMPRWDHPERGLVDPKEFVPAQDSTGMVDFLVRWEIDQALGQCQVWRRDGLQVQLSISLGMAEIGVADLPTYLIERLQSYQLPPDALSLSVRDCRPDHRGASALQNLKVLDRFGVRLFLDQFGGDLHSLAFHRGLPLYGVKIDEQFVSAMAIDEAARHVVAAAVQTAHALGWRALAKGVENADTLQLLRGMACDLAQGYYFGTPLTAVDFDSWLSHQARRFTGAEALSPGV